MVTQEQWDQWDQEDMMALMEFQELMEYQDIQVPREREDIWVSTNTEMINQNTYANVNHFHVLVFFFCRGFYSDTENHQYQITTLIIAFQSAPMNVRLMANFDASFCL